MRCPQTKMVCGFGLAVSENPRAVLRCVRGKNLSEGGGGKKFQKKFSEGGGKKFPSHCSRTALNITTNV